MDDGVHPLRVVKSSHDIPGSNFQQTGIRVGGVSLVNYSPQLVPSTCSGDKVSMSYVTWFVCAFEGITSHALLYSLLQHPQEEASVKKRRPRL